MSDLSELYEELIKDHSKQPRNFRDLPDANHKAVGQNPLCGDHLIVYLNLQDDKITDVAFRGDGCAISKSSASLMTQALKGKTKDEAERMFAQFHELLTGPHDAEVDTEKLGKLAVFSGVRRFPVRVKCATLAWHTLLNALNDRNEPASTE